MITALAESSGSSSSSSAFGGLFVILVIAFFLYRRHKKKATSEKASKKVEVTVSDTLPKTSRNHYSYDDSGLLSIAKFQKHVYDRFVVFDLETTGLDPMNDRIVEIGAVRVENGKITDKYQKLINPGIAMPEEASAKNHITDSMLKKCPDIKEVLPSFLKFVGSDVLVAHNAAFDASFLKKACADLHYPAPTEYFDTMRLSVYWPDLPNRKLESFLKAACIKNDSAHRALGDAKATAELTIISFDKIK